MDKRLADIRKRNGGKRPNIVYILIDDMGFGEFGYPALSKIRDRPVVLSPRDWSLVVEWHAREIPLAVTLEVLEESAARSRTRGSGSGPRSLAYIAPAVKETWELIVAGRADCVGASPRPVPTVSSVRRAWERAQTAAGEGSALHDVLRDLLARLDRGESPVDLDHELDRSIASCRARGDVDRIEKEVDDELAPFRTRVPPERLAETRARAVAARLRLALDLPRLSVAARDH